MLCTCSDEYIPKDNDVLHHDGRVRRERDEVEYSGLDMRKEQERTDRMKLMLGITTKKMAPNDRLLACQRQNDSANGKRQSTTIKATAMKTPTPEFQIRSTVSESAGSNLLYPTPFNAHH